jgi:hypothetical protein
MDYRRRLLFHGMALFLIGLLTGLAEQHFTNVRMALAAHLEGVMNGTFLLAVGAIWSEVRLSSRANIVAFLGAARRDIWQLCRNDIRRHSRDRGAFTDNGSRIRCRTVARSLRYRRICHDRTCDHFSVDIAFVGAAKQGDARCPMRNEK